MRPETPKHESTKIARIAKRINRQVGHVVLCQDACPVYVLVDSRDARMLVHACENGVNRSGFKKLFSRLFKQKRHLKRFHTMEMDAELAAELNTFKTLDETGSALPISILHDETEKAVVFDCEAYNIYGYTVRIRSKAFWEKIIKG